MADLSNNVRFTWQLVSQFVSWEFCRYVSENNENNNSETDVLAFLRNMVVQRTEKSVSDVTKHEILAKFIMEIKAINNFQVSSIIPLSESVKRICPELSSAVNTLVHHLDTFFGVLESTDESRKELIRLRIEDSISDFSKEASRLLPEPDLLQVVDSWKQIHHHHNHPHTELKKSAYNAALFERVLECLHFEGMTPSEARLIAVALNEDKIFENILRNAEAEPETEADSEAFTFSQSSQPVYSQEFIKSTQATKTGVNPLNHRSPRIPQAHSQVPLVDDNSPLQFSDESPVQPNGLDLPQNEDPPDSLAGTPPSPPPSPVEYPLLHRSIFDKTGNTHLQKSASDMQFAQSSANESDEGDMGLHDRIQAKFQQIQETQIRQEQSECDTSDCDQNSEIRFLTPTYFKKGQRQVIYVSDVESNNSSIITNLPSSQQTDPSWSRRKSFLPATQYVRPNKRKKKINAPVNKKRKNSPVKKRKPAMQISSTDSEESLAQSKSPYDISACTIDELRSPHLISVSADYTIDEHRSPHIISVSPTCTLDELRSPHLLPTSATRTRAGLKSPHRPSTSNTRTQAELGRPLKRGKMTKALYRSPTLCIDDFISTLRKPNSDTLSEVSVPNVTTAKNAKKTVTTTKKQKCKQCNRTYKTTIALRRHMFLKHTEPPEDSDCDT